MMDPTEINGINESMSPRFIKTRKGKITIFAVLVLLVAALLLFVFGGEKGYRTISISELFGNVIAENNGNEFEAYPDMHLREGHALSTYQESYVRMALDDDKYVKLEENSRAEFRTLGASDSGNTVIYLDRGAITNEITKPLGEDESYVVHTPNAVLAVRGTFFRVEVKQDENGEILTDIYTYGGAVTCKRILPDGEVVEEKVIVDQGYCTTVSMDEIHTVYVIEEIVPDREHVEPIHKEDISEKDLIEVYVAAVHGHEMFLPVEEIWEEIETREIRIEEHVSQYDKSPIPVYEISEPIDEGSSESSDLESGEEFELNSPTEAERVREDATAGEENLSGLNTEMLQQIPNEPLVDSVLEVPEEVVSGPSVETDDNDDDDGSQNDSDKEDSNTQENPDTGTDHVHTEVTETQAATCTAAGKTTVKCSECGEVISETEIAATGHTETTETQNATCTTEGKTIVKCSVCGEVISETETAATGHTETTETQNAMCTTAGKTTVKCGVCGEVISETEIAATGHTETTETQNATCTTAGKTTVKCSVCGETISETEVSALGHTEETNTQNATCTVAGKTTVKCSVCGDVISETNIPETGHTEETVTTATCTMAGVTRVTCSVCDEVISETNTPAKGHTTATKIENGKKITYCTVCNDELSSENVVVLDANNFPDENFRQYIASAYDRDMDDALTDEEIAQVTSINVRGNSMLRSLQGIAYFTELTELTCSITTITSLDVSSNEKLQVLDCSSTSITSLDVSGNENLRELSCDGSTSLATLNLSGSENLQVLNCGVTSLTALDLSKNTELTELTCNAIATLTQLDVSKNTKLIKLNCSSTNLTSLDVSQNTELESLNISNCSLTHVNVGQNTVLTSANVNSSNCGITIELEQNITAYDLNNLNGVSGFDINKVLTGGGDAVYDSGTKTFTNINLGTNNPPWYSYNIGKNKNGDDVTATFIIKFVQKQ